MSPCFAGCLSGCVGSRVSRRTGGGATTNAPDPPQLKGGKATKEPRTAERLLPEVLRKIVQVVPNRRVCRSNTVVLGVLCDKSGCSATSAIHRPRSIVRWLAGVATIRRRALPSTRCSDSQKHGEGLALDHCAKAIGKPLHKSVQCPAASFGRQGPSTRLMVAARATASSAKARPKTPVFFSGAISSGKHPKYGIGSAWCAGSADTSAPLNLVAEKGSRRRRLGPSSIVPSLHELKS
jgi:hypothetical protein